MRITTLSLAGCVFLCACSGGAGSSGAPDLMSAPGGLAASNYFSNAQSSTLRANDSAGNSYVLKIGASGASSATFEGMPASVTVQSVEIDKNGSAVVNGVSDKYFNQSPFEIFGSQGSTGNPYITYSSPGMLPATVTVGENGPVGTGIIYHDSSKSVVDADITDTYSVAQQSPSSVLLCITSRTSNVTSSGTSDGLSDLTETDCYSDTATGSAALASVDVSVNGTTLAFR